LSLPLSRLKLASEGEEVAIFALCQLSENAIYEHDDVLNIAFMDQEKAFSRVNQRELGSVFEGYGVKGQYVT